MKGKHEARLRRIRDRLNPPPAPDGIDYTKPPDPLQLAILNEMESYPRKADLGVPLKYMPDEYVAEMTRVCVGRALVDADLSADEIAELAPQYEALFKAYDEETAPAPLGAYRIGVVLMVRCGAIKPNGERCGAGPIEGSEWCWNHHPKYADARRRKTSKGGKTGGRGRPTEVGTIKAELRALTNRVLEGEVETGKAAVANQLLNTVLRAVELERKIKETDELEARLEELEASAKQGRPRWHA